MPSWLLISPGMNKRIVVEIYEVSKRKHEKDVT